MRNASIVVILSMVAVARADDWPQWRGPTRDGVWRETGLVEKFAGPEVPIVWRVPVGAGYSGPTVAGGKVFLTDRIVEPTQQERVHCFDAATGKTLWTHTYEAQYRVGYPAGPRANVTVADGKAYALGTMGHLHCFDAATGKVLWSHDLGSEYKIRMPIWGISGAPLVEGNLLFVQVGGEGATIVAFDRETGAEKWRALDDDASYAAPILVEQGGKQVCACMTGESIVGLDPQTGALHWHVPFPPKNMPIGVATPIYDPGTGRLFMTSFYDGSLMLQLDRNAPTAKELWRRVGRDEKHTDALHSIISTPLFLGDYVYGVDSYGELRCLNAQDGERVWENLSAVPTARWSTIHFVQNGDRTWLFTERGDLIIAKLSPSGYEEISRAKLIAPTREQLGQRGGVCWAHPAYADRRVFIRNDEELVCGELAASR